MNYTAEYQIYPQPQALAQAVAKRLISLSKQFLAEHHQFNLALAGGSTPNLLYQTLASDSFKDTINWNKTHLFLSDERFVTPNSPDSNQYHARQNLINHISIPPQNLHFPQTSDIALEKSAQQYSQHLGKHFGAATPSLDLILLGIGPDGHTASIFPHSSETTSPSSNLILPITDSPKPPPERISFSYKLINAAKHIFILATGQSKQAVIQQIFSTPPNPEQLPIQGVQPDRGELVWFLDQPAAKSLS